MRNKILLVEDEINIASFIKRGLEEFGYEVVVANDGEAGWQEILGGQFQMLIFDIVMPKLSGLDLCRRYREQYGYATPVLLLTALGTTENIVEGLEAGADEYIVKPFSFRELQARIAALLRRSKMAMSMDGEHSLVDGGLQVADLTLNLSVHRAERQGQVIDLTTKECRLLEFFIHNKGVVLNRETLLKNVWDKNFDTNTNVVDVYVNYLRNKIDKGFSHKLIKTVMGVGYVMES